MKRTLLLAALATFGMGYALADFPSCSIQLPANYTDITDASVLTSVSLTPAWGNNREIRLVEDGPKAYYINMESDAKVFATNTEVTTSLVGTEIIYTFPKLTENGEWEVVIPAGNLECPDNGDKNPEYTKAYTLADPTLDLEAITPVTLTPAPGTALKGINSETGEWTVAFDPEIQKNAGYMKISVTDADPSHIYEDEAFFQQIQINRRENLATGEKLDIDLAEPFKFTWGGNENTSLMYQGYEYSFRFEVRVSEYNEARDGIGEVLGVYECTYKGNTLPDQYADIKLVNVTPTPYNYDPQNPDGYIFEDSQDPHVTLIFDKAVEPVYSYNGQTLTGVNTGSGTSVPFEGTAESFGDGKEWRFTIPKSQIQPPSMYLFFAFKDPETDLPVKGNNGRGNLSTFSFEWMVELGLPTLTAVSPEPMSELDEISRITLSNSDNLYFIEGTGSSEKATLSTKQGGVVYTFDSSMIEFDNSSETKTVTLVADPAFNTPGAYVLTVPKGFFTLAPTPDLEQFAESFQNKAFNCEFYIKETETPETFNAVFLRSEPENNSTVATLNYAELFFDIPAGQYVAQNYEYDGERPVLKNEAGEKAADIDVMFGAAENSMMVSFVPAIIDAGVYSITFPAKYFMQDQSSNYTPEFSLSWTVEGGGAPVEVAYDLELTSDPADNASVTEIGTLSIKYSRLASTADGSMFKAVLMKDGSEVASTFLMPDWTGEFSTGVFNPAITETGTYTLTVPQGTFITDDKLHANPETTFKWTVEPNAVGMIRFENGNAGNVYTLDGRLVVKDATSSDIEKLEKGIYLIGSRKVVVK